MREIKFRAWNRITKQMYWWGIPETSDGHITTHEFLKGNGVIMQFTGLPDKQGKEVYEGDIVKYKARSYGGFYDEDVIVIGEVMFNYSRWRVERRVATPDNRMTPEFDFHYNVRYIEVIGNIYENPELIPHSPSFRKGAKE